VVSEACWLGDGGLFGPAQRVVRSRLWPRGIFCPSEWVAHGLGLIAPALVFVVSPFVLLVLREPVRKGRITLATETTDGQSSRDREAPADLTLAESLRTGAFWLLAGSAAAFNLVASGLGLLNEGCSPNARLIKGRITCFWP
jgi:hypothetical protein